MATSTTAVPTPSGPIAVHHWAGPVGAPAALLVHGTGFCGSVWSGVAEPLSQAFDVWAVDRRGHGASHKPARAYDFADFADDLTHVVDALALHDALGVGHSAGGTDLLLATARRPSVFRRIVVVEPTVMDHAHPDLRPELAPFHAEALERTRQRRDTFASAREVLDRYRGRGIFSGWRDDLLEAYVRDGFEVGDDGSAVLRCRPSMEAAMLVPIFAVMEGRYRVDDPMQPFEALRTVDCPTLLMTTELSQPVYKQMAEVAGRLLPQAARHHLPGVGHAVAQTAPDALAELSMAFWSGRPLC